MALPTALQNRIRQWIDGVEVVEATEVSISNPRPVGFKFGAAGPIGPYKGQAASTVTINFAQVAQKSQFELMVSQLSDFAYVFTKGSSRMLLEHCELGAADMRGNYESGDTSTSTTIVGIGPTQIS